MSLFKTFDQALFRGVGYPYMRVTRDDASFERVQYLTKFLRDQNEPVRVLDAGCGGGISLYMIEREVPELARGYVGVDLNASRLSPRYKHFKTPNEFFDTNLDNEWDFGKFDVAWCSECLEHIMDDKGAFRKVCRSVKPGGHVLVSVPSEAYRQEAGKALPELLLTSPTQDGGHVRVGYTPDSLAELARGTKAKLLRVDAITHSDETYMRRRVEWSAPMQWVRNLYYTLTRKPKDLFTLNATADDLKTYQSIAAVYRIEE